MNHPLAEMLRYNRWATLRLLEACRSLPEEALDYRLPAASGSVRELLLHLIGSQQTFALRSEGHPAEGELTRSTPWPGFDALAEAATTSADALVAMAETLEADAEVSSPFRGKSYRYPKSFFLVHAMAHGTEHRTEVALTLAHFGIATPDLDGWQYAAAAGYGGEE